MTQEPQLFIAHQASWDMVVDALPRRRDYQAGWAGDVMYQAATQLQVAYALRRVTGMRNLGEL